MAQIKFQSILRQFKTPEMIIESSKKFGSQCIVVAIDAKKNGNKWEVFTHGGRNNYKYRCNRICKKNGR